MSPFDLTTRSFGLLNRLPSYLSATVTNLPSTSLATRRSPCWQSRSSPALLIVIPLDPGSLPVNGAVPVYPLGLRNSLTPPSADHCQAVFVWVSEKSSRLCARSQIGPSTHLNLFSTSNSTTASSARTASRPLSRRWTVP